MKKKQKQQLKDKSAAELTRLVAIEREELTRIVLKQDEQKDKNKARTLRSNIARMLTFLHAKTLSKEA